MSKEITILLPQTATVGAFASPKQQGAGYHRYNDGIHTFVITFAEWDGELKLQGTLSLYPGDDDWFDLKDLDNQAIIYTGDTDGLETVSSRGNFVWIRAVGSITEGEITEISYNY